MYQTHINLMLFFFSSKIYTFCQFHFWWESSTMSFYKPQMKKNCYWCWAEISTHFDVNLSICNVVLSQHYTTVLSKCEAYNFVTNRQKWVHISFSKNHGQVFNQSIFCSVFHSVFQSSPTFSNTQERGSGLVSMEAACWVSRGVSIETQ